ncbi:hypothetical protein QJS66_04940 [Kocuria rhizophila]|nr:hypothetical protein QJS66_04940 [Kocuria rhizophila]
MDVDVTQEMETSFLEYSYSATALPRPRQMPGTASSPVQRRILFMMDQMGPRPDRGHVRARARGGRGHGQAAPPTATPRSTTRWSAWRSWSPCARPWWTATATSAR